jgi:hypothetical protein
LSVVVVQVELHPMVQVVAVVVDKLMLNQVFQFPE